MINFSEIKIFEQIEFDKIFLIYKLFDQKIGQISIEKKDSILISDFEVKEDLRGFGVGSFILKTCIDWLDKLELTLDYVALVNTYSINIFLRSGFEVKSYKYLSKNHPLAKSYTFVVYKNYSH